MLALENTMNKIKINNKILNKVGKAIKDFDLIQDKDRILVALSGGKDSWTMLHILAQLREKAPIDFKLTAVTVDPGFEGFRTDLIEKYLKENNFEYVLRDTNMIDILKGNLNPGSSFCSFCARLRRGVLYTFARENGFNKIALGHHCDDTIETLLLNQFYSGQIKAMPPKLYADDGKNIVIRPMIYVKESEIKTYTSFSNFPIICCKCPVCSDSGMKRKQIKKLLSEMEAEHEGIKSNILNSLTNVAPSHLLDTDLFPALIKK
jgi:tRNA 2-thiocytidine biosynthesis protein TtcA